MKACNEAMQTLFKIVMVAFGCGFAIGTGFFCGIACGCYAAIAYGRCVKASLDARSAAPAAASDAEPKGPSIVKSFVPPRPPALFPQPNNGGRNVS